MLQRNNSVVPAQSHTWTKKCSKESCTLWLLRYPQPTKQYKKAEHKSANDFTTHIYIFTYSVYIDICIYKCTVLHPEALQVRKHVNRHAYMSKS